MSNKQYTDNEILNKYLRSSRGIRSVARMMGIPKTRVGKIINQYHKSSRMSYNNYINTNRSNIRSWR
jgi:hypothetical protein